MGERVPEVMMTDWKRSSTGLMAREASRQHSCSRGSFTPDMMLPCDGMRLEKDAVEKDEVRSGEDEPRDTLSLVLFDGTKINKET
jgi:hypothetical protein